jgi:hypothetical protein
VDCISLARDKDQRKDSSEHGNEPSCSINAGTFLNGCTTVGLSLSVQLQRVSI